jgi:putative endopeptidase
VKKHGGTSLNGLSGNQRFFIGFALFERENVRPEFEKTATLTDPHSPGKFRINGPVANFERFYEAYSVKQGDKLWRAPAARTMVW